MGENMMDSRIKAALLVMVAVALAFAAIQAEDADAASGTCGSNVTWSLVDEDLVLTGSGPMYDYQSGKAPWYQERASIKTLTVGGSVTSIGNHAFYGCSSLTALELSNASSVGFKAFANCTSLSDVVLDGVETIGGYAFFGCNNLCSISFSDGLSSVGTSAFGTSKFSTDSGPVSPTASNLAGCRFVGSNSVLSLKTDDLAVGDEFVCSGIKFKAVSLNPNQASVAGRLPGTTVIDVPGSVSYSSSRFAVVSVENQAFYNDSEIVSVDLEKVQNIGFKAFANCTSLKTVVLGSIESIGSYAFFGCTGLCSVSLSDSLVSIGTSAFGKTKFVIDGIAAAPVAKNLAGREFAGSDGVLHDVQETVAVGTMFSSDSIDYLVVSASPRQVSVAGCASGVESITVPDSIAYKGNSYSVVSVKDQAFYNNAMIKSVDLGGVTAVGFKSFANCTNLESIKMNSVVSIGNYAFFGCTGLTSAEFSEGLESIGASSFTKVKFFYGTTEMPASISNLAGKAFTGQCGTLYLCEAGVAVGTTFMTGALMFEVVGLNPDKVALCGVSAGTRDVVVPEKVTYNGSEFLVASVADQAFYNNKAIVSIDLGGVTAVGFKSFANCVLLKTVKMDDVVSIGKYAFFGCTGLSSISFSTGLRSVESSSFGKISFNNDSGAVNANVFNLAGKTFEGSKSVLYEKRSEIVVGTTFSAGGVQYRVTSISPLEAAVAGSTLKDVLVPGEVVYDGQSIHVVSVADQAFYNNKTLTSIDLGDVKSVGFKSFANCVSLSEVSLPSVETIGKFAFFGSTGMSTIRFSDSLSSVGMSAFTKISFYKGSLEIAATVKNLAGKTFEGSGSVLYESSGSPVIVDGPEENRNADVTYNFEIRGATPSSKAGFKNVVADIVIRNNNCSGGHEPLALYYALMCTDNSAYDYGAQTGIRMGDVTISAGSSKVFTLVYEVPSDTDPLYVKYNSTTYGYTLGYDPSLPISASAGTVADLAEGRGADVTYNFEIRGATPSSKAGFKNVVADIVIRNNNCSGGHEPLALYYALMCTDNSAYDYGAQTGIRMGDVTISAGSSKVFTLVYEVPSDTDPLYVKYNSTTYGYTLGYDPDLSFS